MGDLVSLTAKLESRRGCVRAVSAAEHYERGLAFEAAEQPDAAVAAYRRALASRPDMADACNNLGRLLHDRDQLGEAESLYRLAICAAGEVGLYWFNLGVVCEDTGRCAEAIAAYERALGLEPTLADAHFNLARQLEQVGRRGADDLVMRRAVRHLKRYRDLVRTGLG
ncbi:MAG TPA: tetratricopeptide repeat protein [Kofleriaceae bacterium]